MKCRYCGHEIPKEKLHCGYCGKKLTNGTKYNYWTIKDTGEKRASKIPIYRCQSAQIGIPHNKTNQFRADNIEKVVFDCLGEYIDKLQENENIMSEIEANQNKEKKAIEKEIKKLYTELEKIEQGIKVMQSHIPDAMTGDYPLSVEEIANAIHAQQEMEQAKKQLIVEKEQLLKEASISNSEWNDLKIKLPTWKQVFKEADCPTQRVLVNKLIERIDITQNQIVIRFRINLNDFLSQPRMSDDFGVPESRL